MWRHQQFDLMKPFSLKCCQQHPNPKIVCQPETSQRKYSWIILWNLISTGCSFNNLVSTIRLPCVPNPVDHAWPFFLPDPSSAPAFFRLFLHVQSLGLVRHDFFCWIWSIKSWLDKSSWWVWWSWANLVDGTCEPLQTHPLTSDLTPQQVRAEKESASTWSKRTGIGSGSRVFPILFGPPFG